MSMNTPLGSIQETTPISSFKELTSMELNQYLLGINNILQGDGARITLQNLIKGIISTDENNLITLDSNGRLSVTAGAFNTDTGWATAPTITIDWSAGTVMGVGGLFYLEGVLVSALSNFIADNMPTDVGKHYLYYNTQTQALEWSTGYPTVQSDFVHHICEIVILADGNKFAIQTWEFGGTSESVIKYLNATIGMVVLSGGQILNVVTDTPQQRYPVINQAKVGLANFSQILATTSTRSIYMQARATAKNVLTCEGGKPEIVPVNVATNAPMYNKDYTLTALESGKFMNVWLVGLPVAGTTPYTINYLYVTGDTQYDDLASAAAADPVLDSSMLAIANQFERYCVMARFTLTYTGEDFNITNYKKMNLTLGGSSSADDNGNSGIGLPIGSVYPLACSTNYVPENSLPCDGAEYTKDQFNDLWENYLTSEETETTYILNNCISVVGELASQQGIYSGFAEGKYLTVSIPEILAGETVTYTFKYNAGSDVTTSQDLFDTDIDPATKYLKLSNGKFLLSGIIQNTLDISPNSPFYIRLLISNTTLNIYVSKDGTNYYDLTAWNISNITSVNLGVVHNYGDPYTPFLGNIDLASSTLTYKSGDTVNLAEIKTVQKTLLNTCTYSEYASDISTYGQCGKFAVKPLAFDSSKITIVGTPTISEDGVVSDFSTSNYVKTSINIDGSITKIREEFHISTFENTTISELYRSNCFVLMIGTGSNYNLRARVGNAAENNWLMVNYTMLPNKGYIGECVINKTTKLATLNLYDENNNLLGTYTNSTPFVSITLTDEDNTVTIGYGNNRAFTNGTIDLTQFSITVDGDEVYNCVSGNTFKVPTIKDGAVVQQALTDSELGKSYKAGLPNITGVVGQNTNSGLRGGSEMSSSGSLYLSKNGSYSYSGFSTSGSSDRYDIHFDASLSNAIYGNSTTVQPNAVALRYFVVVANGQINQSIMDWSAWASSLQGKANTDLSNLSDVGKKVIDGQWISSPHLLSSATATGTYTIDLSSYLPNDNYTYEVILNIKTYHTENCNVTVYTNDFPPFEFSSKTYTTDIGQYARSQANTFILPVSQKQVLMKIGTAKASENYLSMIAYRRVGTNV